MRFIIVTDDADQATLEEEAIGNLRDRQRRCVIASTRDELEADINELLEMRGHRGTSHPTTP